jgi:protein AroM
MAKKRIGALTIGQSPRPDLVDPLKQLLPECEILQAGALDGLTINELPEVGKAAYPLVTRMQNGSQISVDESYLLPKLKAALKLLEAKDVFATLLMCAGTFTKLHGTQPLYKPFNIGRSVLRAIKIKSIGLIAPVIEQEEPIRHRWEAQGWKTSVWTADLRLQDKRFYQQIKNQILTNDLECIVLDYFGHPTEQVSQLQRSIDLPIIDLGSLAMYTLAGIL